MRSELWSTLLDKRQATPGAIIPQTLVLGPFRVPACFQLLGLACLITLALLWPFSLNPTQLILDDGDALHQAWSIYWVQRALLDPGQAWYAPSNFPAQQALLFNQPIYSAALLGLPLHLLGLGALPVYNALVLLSTILACWSVAMLGNALTGSRTAGMVAGILYAFAAVRQAHLVHLNLLSGFWTALLLLALLRLWRQPPGQPWRRLRLILLIGGLAALQALADVYTGMYMLLALPLLAPFLLRRPQQYPPAAAYRPLQQVFLPLVLALLLAISLCLPVLLPTLRLWSELGLQRDASDHLQYAAALDSYLQPFAPSRLGYNLQQWYSPSQPGSEFMLWPGLVTILLAGLGLLAAPRRLRSLHGYFGLIALLALLLSLGPELRLRADAASLPSPLYRWLLDELPLFSALRVPARWGLLLQLALAVLAASGAASLLELPAWLHKRRLTTQVRNGLLPLAQSPGLIRPIARLARRPWNYRLRRLLAQQTTPALAMLLTALALADVWAGPLHGSRALLGEQTPAVYQALRSLPPGALLEWPLENSNQRLAHRYEYFSLVHGRPIVNSASSIVPQRYQQLHDFLRGFPDQNTIGLLNDLGVRYVNVNRWELSGWEALHARLQASPGLRLIGSYEHERHLLYEVLPQQAPAAPAQAVLIDGANGSVLQLNLAAPLWLADPQAYYTADRDVLVRLIGADGAEQRSTLRLPPLLLPGSHRLSLPQAQIEPAYLVLGEHSITVYHEQPAALAEVMVDGPQLLASVPALSYAGETLSCRAYGKGPLPERELLLTLALVDANWQLLAKQDLLLYGDTAAQRWPTDGFTALPCLLTLPADLPSGSYYLTLSLWDVAASAPYPIAGSDGQVHGAWRLSQPLQVQQRARGHTVQTR